MWSIILIGFVNIFLIMLAAYLENGSENINTSYSNFFRLVVFVIPGRLKYFSPLIFFNALVFELNLIWGVIGFLNEKNGYIELAKAIANILPAVIVISYLLDILFYRIINARKVDGSTTLDINGETFCLSIGGDVIDEIKYIKGDYEDEVVIILSWLHDIDYSGNLRFRKYNDRTIEYNFMFYNSLINELTSQSKSAVLVRYTECSRLFPVEKLLMELSDVIRKHFGDKKVSIIAHGPQAGVEALLFMKYYDVKSVTLLCGGIGVGEYYISSIEQIINERKTTFPWDRNILKQQKNAIKNVKSHSECKNCALLNTASTFENTCHGFCGKNITPYFDSINNYSTENLMKMMNNSALPISIVWPEFAVGPWSKYIDKWRGISNVNFEMVENCYETFRERKIKDKPSYADVYIVR